MSKLTAQGSSQNRPFKPKIYQGKRRGQAKNYYVNVDFSSCFSNVVSDFLLNKINFVGGDKFENWQKLVSSNKIDLVQEKITYYKNYYD